MDTQMFTWGATRFMQKNTTCSTADCLIFFDNQVHNAFLCADSECSCKCLKSNHLKRGSISELKAAHSRFSQFFQLFLLSWAFEQRSLSFPNKVLNTFALSDLVNHQGTVCSVCQSLSIQAAQAAYRLPVYDLYVQQALSNSSTVICICAYCSIRSHCFQQRYLQSHQATL